MSYGDESYARVSGADYNTYARLRRLKAERAQLTTGGYHGRTWTERSEVGNTSGIVLVPLELLALEPVAPVLEAPTPAIQ